MRSLITACLFILVSSTVYAHPGIGIVRDSKGNIFYTDLSHVWKISPKGDLSIAVKDIHTHELYIDDQDNLYGEHEWYNGERLDTWGNYVWRLSYDGCFEIVIPEVEGFLENNTLVRDSHGGSYWVDHTKDHDILNYTSIDNVNTQFSLHKFNDIRWMHYSHITEALYLVDGLELKKIDNQGRYELISDDLKEDSKAFGGVKDRHYIFGVWANSAKEVFVAVYGAAKVKKIDTDGKIMTLYESEDSWSPCGGLVSPNGTHWILEFSRRNKTRVVRLDEDGNYTIYSA